MPKKIAMIGAGSVVFCKTLMSDIMATPALSDSEFALMDLAEVKLRVLLRDFLTPKLDDLAAVLTYIRSSWGNQAPAITPEQITAIKTKIGNHPQPFTAGELK